MKFEKKRSGVSQEIPTASMPDIIFMLLLFFMVATTLKETQDLVKYTLPEAGAVEKIEDKRLVTYIYIGSDEKVQIDDSIVKVEEIQDIMYRKAQDLPSLVVSLRADKGSRMKIITDVQMALRKAYCLKLNYSAQVKF